MRNILLLNVHLLGCLVLIGEIDTAGHSLGVLLVISAFELFDTKDLNDAGGGRFFLDLFLLLSAIENGLGLIRG